MLLLPVHVTLKATVNDVATDDELAGTVSKHLAALEDGGSPTILPRKLPLVVGVSRNQVLSEFDGLIGKSKSTRFSDFAHP